eukprot:CAMPEP_0114289028 /NCGR_PEP_ID=MMETSP0059-20121206/7141_1 /TAXON_ID=36894 /ORGANISM="Pyramimonas parkeae, Strain CCMP726" /LENGTH=104 /DNA_ID=CAMNT_0001410245 /DNA_START=131 /DNA_END=442 /DNA_ORIENTATION=-
METAWYRHSGLARVSRYNFPFCDMKNARVGPDHGEGAFFAPQLLPSAIDVETPRVDLRRVNSKKTEANLSVLTSECNQEQSPQRYQPGTDGSSNACNNLAVSSD